MGGLCVLSTHVGHLDSYTMLILAKRVRMESRNVCAFSLVLVSTRFMSATGMLTPWGLPCLQSPVSL